MQVTSSSADSLDAAIAPYRVFNMLNNSGCLKPADVREAQKFNSNRIRGSTLIDNSNLSTAKSCIEEIVLKQKGSFGIVIVFDCNASIDSIRHLTGYIRSTHDTANTTELDDASTCCWKRLEFVYSLDFDLFYGQYAQCAALFDGESNPLAPRFKGRNKYFATEIIPGFLFLG